MRKQSFGFACWSGPADLMATPHVHDDVEANICLDAPLHYLIGGRVQSVPPRRLCLFWASTPHQLVGPLGRTRVIWLTIPLELFLSWRVPEPLISRLLRSEIVPATAAVPHPVETMRQWSRDLGQAPDEPSMVTVGLEAQAMVRRLARDLGDGDRTHPHEPPGHPLASSAVAAMARYVAEHFREPLRAADVAAAAHLSEAYAMTLFRRQVGMTIGGYVEQCRIAEAQRLLVTTGDSILRVAETAGFGSVSRFHAAFKAATRTTPARYRRTRALPAVPGGRA